MKNTALIAAGTLFSIITVLHIVRYLKGWTVVIANQEISLDASIYAGIVVALFALWMFIAATRN